MLYEHYLDEQWEAQRGSEEIQTRDFFEFAIESRRERALELIEGIAGTQIPHQFLQILSSAYSIDCEHAIKLAYDLNLEQLDFLAIDGDIKGFEKEYLNQN
jgi:hypothetical protein